MNRIRASLDEPTLATPEQLERMVELFRMMEADAQRNKAAAEKDGGGGDGSASSVTGDGGEEKSGFTMQEFVESVTAKVCCLIIIRPPSAHCIDLSL